MTLLFRECSVYVLFYTLDEDNDDEYEGEGPRKKNNSNMTRITRNQVITKL